MGPLNAKYPRTPYWPWSPSIGRDDGVHPDPSRFVGESVVVTEKLDGGNTDQPSRLPTPHQCGCRECRRRVWPDARRPPAIGRCVNRKSAAHETGNQPLA